LRIGLDGQIDSVGLVRRSRPACGSGARLARLVDDRGPDTGDFHGAAVLERGPVLPLGDRIDRRAIEERHRGRLDDLDVPRAARRRDRELDRDTTGLASAVLGTLAGLALGKRGGFAGRRLFATMIGGPIVLPDVVLGLALLLLFLALQTLTGFPAQRGALTIVLPHTTFGSCYVALIVQARFRGLDRALEEAAMDLGARPFKVLMTITVPLLVPAILAASCSPSRCRSTTSS